MNLFNQNQGSNLFAPKDHRDAAGLYIRAEDGLEEIGKGMIVTLLAPDLLAVVTQPEAFRAWLAEYGSYGAVEEMVKEMYYLADPGGKEKALQGFGLRSFPLESIPEEKRRELRLSGLSRDYPSLLESEF